MQRWVISSTFFLCLAHALWDCDRVFKCSDIINVEHIDTIVTNGIEPLSSSLDYEMGVKASDKDWDLDEELESKLRKELKDKDKEWTTSQFVPYLGPLKQDRKKFEIKIPGAWFFTLIANCEQILPQGITKNIQVYSTLLKYTFPAFGTCTFKDYYQQLKNPVTDSSDWFINKQNHSQEVNITLVNFGFKWSAPEYSAPSIIAIRNYLYTQLKDYDRYLEKFKSLKLAPKLKADLGKSNRTGIDWTTDEMYMQLSDKQRLLGKPKTVLIKLPSNSQVKIFQLVARCGQKYKVYTDLLFLRVYDVNVNAGCIQTSTANNNNMGTIEDCEFCPELNCEAILNKEL